MLYKNIPGCGIIYTTNTCNDDKYLLFMLFVIPTHKEDRIGQARRLKVPFALNDYPIYTFVLKGDRTTNRPPNNFFVLKFQHLWSRVSSDDTSDPLTSVSSEGNAL